MHGLETTLQGKRKQCHQTRTHDGHCAPAGQPANWPGIPGIELNCRKQLANLTTKPSPAQVAAYVLRP